MVTPRNNEFRPSARYLYKYVRDIYTCYMFGHTRARAIQNDNFKGLINYTDDIS